MKESKTLIGQQLKSLQTQAGQTPSTSDGAAGATDLERKLTPQQKQELSQAVNVLFTLLEDAFPTKFKHAFRSAEDRQRAQRVWMSSLKVFPPQLIVEVAREAIKTSKYFPDLGEIYRLCRAAYTRHGLKEPLQAYYEACNAPQQSLSHSWSHIAVYLAARDTGWPTLRGEEQRTAFPLYEQNYELWCNRVLEGEDLQAMVAGALENPRHAALAAEVENAASERLQQKMQQQGIDPTAGRQAFIDMKKKMERS
ncbi:replication protein P [Aestuariirhabdus sp. LZHN29]|uniref:replication protein P n=1 Tax=Aestuariirhabdus sp. LZHN29 TaxID=3417462 RepID=UPI003CF9AA7A